MSKRSIRRSGAPLQKGFTLPEALITLLIVVAMILSILALFQVNTNVSRVQSQVTDMQQSLRVAQDVLVKQLRMTGRGGVGVGTLPNGASIEVIDQVPDNTYIDAQVVAGVLNQGTNTLPEVQPGTDILISRGVFSTYLLDLSLSAFTLITQPDGSLTGTFVIQDSVSAALPIAQDLSALEDAITASELIPLILVSATDDGIRAVVELDPTNSNWNPPSPPYTAGQHLIAFRATGGTYTGQYLGLTGGTYPPGLTDPLTVGIVEERRYYIEADDRAGVLGLRPRLSMARIYPGTLVPLSGAVDNWSIPLADNIFDLQVALGIDTDPDYDPGAGSNGPLPADGAIADANDQNDEWLFNHAADDPTDPAWNSNDLLGVRTSLFFVRVTTLALTDRPDPRYQAPPLLSLENHTYASDTVNVVNGLVQSKFRRRLMTTVVDLRNIS